MKFKLKKVISVILCMALLIPLFSAFSLIELSAASPVTESGIASTESVKVFNENGIDYELSRKTQYLGNNLYSTNIDVSSTLVDKSSAQVRTSAKNGYFTVKQDGWYMLELWGGKGARGEDSFVLALIIPVATSGGAGGAYGYTYARVYLKAGQTLVYSIGTNGAQSVAPDDGGGGANGGGEHGSQGSLMVGGGGGYSVFYLLEEGEFKEEYVTDESVNLPDNIRTSRYIMISAGGGGGGAGCGSLLFNGGNPAPPSGGAGGNVTNGYSMALLNPVVDGKELHVYNVPGYIFNGQNGKSSGESTAYVGKGGTNLPGADVSTIWGLSSTTSQANDWAGTYNTNLPAGEGGTGNLRGGGGGAGFAGGSGGIMGSILSASDIGGGGGGSSFIAATVNGKPVQFTSFTDEEKSYIEGFANKPVDGENVGGACQITYIGSDDNLDLSKLNNVTIKGTISPYFEVVKSNCVCSDGGVFTYTTNADGSTSFSVSGLSAYPSSAAGTGETASVTIILRPKEGFVGGNNIPLILSDSEDKYSSILASFDNPHTKSDTKTVVLNADKDMGLDYAHVKVEFKLTTYSFSTSVENKEFPITDFYKDELTEIGTQLKNETLSTQDAFNYSFISSISSYTVSGANGASGKTAFVNKTVPSVTLTVSVTVSMKESAKNTVKVGPANSSSYKIQNTATLSFSAPNESTLNGLSVRVSKGLSYNDGVYKYSVNVNQSSQSITVDGSNEVSGNAWSAPQDGWYYIQVWGANGGNSGSVTGTGAGGDQSRTAGGGIGGLGGYVGGYIYLEAGTIANFTLGAVGSNTTDVAFKASSYISSSWSKSKGASGGSPSTLSIGGQDLIIAGGGGGAGGSALGITQILFVSFSTYQGKTPAQNTAIRTSNNGSYNGNPGITPSTESAGEGGNAGDNYRFNLMTTGYDFAGGGKALSVFAKKYAQSLSTVNPSADGSGYIRFTLLENDEMLAMTDCLVGQESEIAISKYFDIKDNGINLESSIPYTSVTVTDNGDGSVTKTYYNTEVGKLAEFTFRIEKTLDGESHIYIYDCYYIPDVNTVDNGSSMNISYSANNTFSVELTPKEGFVGGNDVPVLGKLSDESPLDKDSQEEKGVVVYQLASPENGYPDDEFINVPIIGSADYANVSFSIDISEFVTVNDLTVDHGTRVTMSSLYTYEPPTVTGWEWDYAKISLTPNSSSNYTKTTTVTPFTLTLEPKTAKASYGTIVPSLSSVKYAPTATVYVRNAITYSGTDITLSGPEYALTNESFVIELKVENGYVLPDDDSSPLENITLKYTKTGTEFTNFVYEKTSNTTATVTVHKDAVTAPITVIASGIKQSYSIHYRYEIYNGSEIVTDYVVQSAHENGDPILAGDAVTQWKLDEIKQIAEANIPAGYKYLWTVETSNGRWPSKMPSNDLWVYGTLVKKTQLVNVSYYYDGGEEAFPKTTVEVAYGDSYSIPSPELHGYIPDIAVVNGTMGLSDLNSPVNVEVTYTRSTNDVLIVYVKPDGTELFRYDEKDLPTDSYTYDFPDSILGYKPKDPNNSSVTVTIDGVNGAYVTVECVPFSYTINFEYRYDDGYPYYHTANGAPTMSGASAAPYSEKLVEYMNMYSYNAASKSYDGLPVAYHTDYTFAGWYLDPADMDPELDIAPLSETEIISALYDDGAEITLYAKWEPTKYKLTVQLHFLTDDVYTPDGVENLLPYTGWHIAGEEVTMDLYQLVGYTSYKDYALNTQSDVTSLKIIMPAAGYKVDIYYEINSYTVVFKDAGGSHMTYYSYEGVEESEPSGIIFDNVWAVNAEGDLSLSVKHGHEIVYSGEAPDRKADGFYFYTFNDWYYTVDGQHYEFGSTLPAATRDAEFYAAYTGQEIIVKLTHNNEKTVKYFTTVSDALDFIKSGELSEYYDIYLYFRRNNSSVLNLDEDPLIFFDTALTNEYSIRLYADGITFETTNGSPALKVISPEGSDPVKLYLMSGTYKASYEGDVCAIDLYENEIDWGTSYVTDSSSAVRIIAESENGDAIGVRINGNGSIYSNKHYDGGIISVSGKNAYGVYGVSDAEGNLGSVEYWKLPISVTGQNIAYGVYNLSSVSLNSTGKISATATEDSSVSAGVHTVGSFSADYMLSNSGIYASGAGDVYGLYNCNNIYLSSSGNSSSNTCVISAETTGVNKNALLINSFDYLKIASGYSLISKADYGNAACLVIPDGIDMSITNLALTAIGKSAVCIRIENGGTLTVNESCSLSFTVKGEDTAIAVDVTEGGTLKIGGTNKNKTGNITVNGETAENGYACFVRNAGSIPTLNYTKITVSSNYKCYGIYNTVNGAIKDPAVSGSSVTAINVIANSESGAGYGLYADGGTVGGAGESTDTKINDGAFAGTLYGIYAETENTVFISGSNLYVKGSDKAHAVNAYVVIFGDPTLHESANFSFIGYYVLTAKFVWKFYLTEEDLTEDNTPYFVIEAIDKAAVVPPYEPTPELGYEFSYWAVYADLSGTGNFERITDGEGNDIPADTSMLTQMASINFCFVAKFTPIEYKIFIDAGISENVEYTVNFYAPFGSGDDPHMLVLSETLDYTDPYLDLGDIPSEIDMGNGTKAIFMGCFADAEFSTPIPLSGDISALDTDGDRIIDIYTLWQGDISTDLEIYKVTTKETVYKVTSEYSASSPLVLALVPNAPGDYIVKLSFDKNVPIMFSLNGSDYSSSEAYISLLGTNEIALPLSDISVLDTLIFTMYAEEGVSEFTVGLVSAPHEFSDDMSFNCYIEIPDSQPHISYNVEMTEAEVMGQLATALPSKTGYDLIGLSYEKDLNNNLITELSSDFIKNFPNYSPKATQFSLYGIWQAHGWDVYGSASRDFSSFEGEDSITVQGSKTLSVRFKCEGECGGDIFFRFRTGLPNGTMLTLIDKSGEYPVFYTYTVTDGVATELSSKLFTLSGDSSVAFGGRATDIILQVCYKGVYNNDAENEQISIYTGGENDNASLYTDIIPIPVPEEKKEESTTADPVNGGQLSVTVPKLTDKGYSPNDQVYVLILSEMPIPAGASFSYGNNNAIIFDANISKIYLGMSVADFDKETVIKINMNFSNLASTRFEAMELSFMMAPMVESVYSDDEYICPGNADFLSISNQLVTMLPADSGGESDSAIRIEDPSERTALTGERLVINGITYDENLNELPSVYIMRYDDSGYEVLEGCDLLFDESTGYFVDDYGAIRNADGNSPIADGAFMALISENALSGTYKLKFVLGNDEVIIRVNVVSE